MYRLLSIATLTVVLLVAPLAEAQECDAVSPRFLRGTYTVTATAWQDLSEINPALPKGYAPVTIIGAFRINTYGELSGWAHVNAGGLRMAAQFVDSSVGALSADCSFPVTLSMKIDDFGGAVVGPYVYTGVVTSCGPELEIAFMMLGAGPGSHVEMDRARRISMRF